MNSISNGNSDAAFQVSSGFTRSYCSDYTTPEEAVEKVVEGLGEGPFSLIVIYMPNGEGLEKTNQLLSKVFQESSIIGCTTAGEICEDGYAEGKIIAIGFPSAYFTASVLYFDEIDHLEDRKIALSILEARQTIGAVKPDWENEFAMLLVDGLSRREEVLANMIVPALGNMPLFGGSAGDGLNFKETRVLGKGRCETNSAVLAVIRSCCPVKVFRLDNFRPTTQRMVVTGAKPEERLVMEINAEPAAREYARIVGKDPNQLSPFTFAAHPVVVKIGDEYHVRAIQKVEEDGSLRFFAAIDEGLVLTVAEAEDMGAHLERTLKELSATEKPDNILACDCVLRRLAAEQIQQTHEISRIMSENHVRGFSTYGEIHNMLHINQTFTGVAIYPPAEKK